MKGAWHRAGGGRLIPKRVGREGWALISLFSFWRGAWMPLPQRREREEFFLPV